MRRERPTSAHAGQRSLAAVAFLAASLAAPPATAWAAFPSPAAAAPQATADLQSAIDAGGARWVARDTPLADLPLEQKRRRTGLPDDYREEIAALAPLAAPVPQALPAAFDWRAAGAVTPPRDQGACGSCWAFATTANLESRVLLSGGGAADTLDLSEQALLSCGDLGGCDGGYPAGSASFIRDRGLPDEGCFGYTASQVACSNACAGWYQDDWRVDAVYGGARPSAAELKAILLRFGPVVGTMAVYEDFYSYGGGVYSHVSGARVAYHAFLIVGYDDAAGAFLCKNSWGTGWGEGGYFRVGYAALSSDLEFADGVVGMGDAIWPGMPASAVTVVSPDGGEQWLAGSTQAIGWKTRGSIGASVKIELLRGTAVDRVIAAAAPAAAGSLSWTLPAALATGDDLRVRVTGSAAAAPADASDGAFSVVGSPPGDAITVTYPAGGESVLRGTQGAVRWTRTGAPGPYVRVDLLKGGVFLETVVPEVQATFGTVDIPVWWWVPAGAAAGSDYQLRVTSTSDATVTALSGFFSVTLPPGDWDEFWSPTRGVVWGRGETRSITAYCYDCGYNYYALMRLDLYKGGAWHSLIDGEAAGMQVYSWTVPRTLPDGEDYRIRVASATYAGGELLSPVFSIRGGAPLALQVLAPNGGETWQLNAPAVVRWAGDPAISQVKIDLLRSGMVQSTLAASTANTGSYAFTLSPLLNLGEYQVRVCDVAAPTVCDLSDRAFRVHATSPGAALAVTSPAGGEIVLQGVAREVAWTATGATGGSVAVELLRGGAVVSVIAPSAASGAGSVAWLPTGLTGGSDYQVRVGSRSDPAVLGLSVPFTISAGGGAATIGVKSPAGGQTWEAGGSYPVSWNWTGAPGDTVSIALVRGGAVDRTLAAAVKRGADGAGSWVWKIPYDLAPAADYRIRVTGSAAGLGESPGFTVVAPPVPSWRLVRSWGGPGTGGAQFQGVAGIAVGRTGRVFVLDSGRESVRVFSTRGGYSTAWGNPGEWEGEFGGLAGIAVGKGEVLHVSEADNQRVQLLKSNGTPQAEWGSAHGRDGDFDSPGAIALESDGDVLLADTLNLEIQHFNPGGEHLGTFGAPGAGDGQFTSLGGLAVAGDGTVLAADGGGNRVLRFSAAGAPLGTIGSAGSAAGQFFSPAGLAVGPDGSIFVADAGNARVQQLSAAGAPLAVLVAAGMTMPRDLALDAAGNLYVTDAAALKVFKFSPAPALTLTAPAAGAVWRRGTKVRVSWVFRGEPKSVVRLELVRGGTVVAVLSAKAPVGANGAGSLAWAVPATLKAATGYTLRLVAGAVTATSGSFRVR